MIKAMKSWLCAALLLSGANFATASDVKPISLNAGIHLIQAEVATTHATRMRGLMHRKTLDGNHGMVFVFPEEGRHCMWMRNTYVPLSVAFIDDRGAIVNIEDMVPQTEDQHCAAQPVRYALEMSKGWFAARGLKPGMRVSGLEQVPGAEE